MKYLLNSGMGDELSQRGFEVPDWKTSIWSASALIKSPNAVVEIHYVLCIISGIISFVAVHSSVGGAVF